MTDTEEPDDVTDAEDDAAGRLFAAWMTVLQAELMLGHLGAAGASWPQANLYCHSCITAMRSVTLLMQRAMRHDPGFEQWYSEVQEVLRADPDFAFLVQARNFVLKQGALRLMMSYSIRYAGRLGMEVRSIGPDGPEVWVREEGSTEWVPAD